MQKNKQNKRWLRGENMGKELEKVLYLSIYLDLDRYLELARSR